MAAPASASGQVHWSSRFAFLMAAIGSAVGLGNLWRFPFQTGENGGSAFVFVYILCVVFIAFPVLVAELSVGRHKGLSAVGSTRNLAVDAGRSPRWAVAGWAGMIAGFLILTTYSLIAGQVMAYSVMSFLGEFSQGASSAGAALPLYDAISDRILWHTLFMALTVVIVARGLTGGIEKVVVILMPLFFVMLAALCVYALATGVASGASAEALAYLFRPNFAAIRPDTVLAALGQAFFSIGVGSAIMITYGSYLSRDEHIPASARIIASADTLVALVAGLMIFPIVFAFSLNPAAGMSLIFEALPSVFAGMPWGSAVGGFFFLLAFIAALTSSISLLQVSAAFAEEYTTLSKVTAVTMFGALAWFIGVGAAYSAEFGGFVDDIVGLIALPLGGLLIAVFAGWVVPSAVMRGELPHASDLFFRVWRFMLRFAVPIAVGFIIVSGLIARFGLASRLFGDG